MEIYYPLFTKVINISYHSFLIAFVQCPHMNYTVSNRFCWGRFTEEVHCPQMSERPNYMLGIFSGFILVL